MPNSKRAPNKPLPPVAYLRERFAYDHLTGELRWQRRPPEHFATLNACGVWNSKYAGEIAGTINAKGYYRVGIDKHFYLAHRIIFKVVTEQEPPDTIDHRDGDPLNNRWSNLRAATRREQAHNRRLRGDNTSGHCGVYPRHGKWQVGININGKQQWRGTYNTHEEAVVVRDTIAREAFGEFHNDHGPNQTK